MTTVVTSENLAEFNAQRMGLNAPAEATETVEPAVEQETSSSDEPDEAETQEEQTEEQKEEPKKANPKLEKRFSELTKQREEARREAQAERDARTALETRLRALEEQNKPAPAPDPDAKPKPEQFNDAFQYAEALAEWSAENALKNRDKAEAEKKQIAERNAVLKNWEQRQTSAREELDDYAEVIESSKVAVSDQVRDAIIESDVGPKILYHLAKNPDVAEALNSKSVISALREIGKLEAKLSGEKTPEPTAKPVVKPSRAPAPINPVRGSSSIDNQVGSDGEFHGTYEAWKQARRAGRIK